jgi:HD-GYP domain-containing protein (c-di-GMP phosphodiesterase class II)
MEKRVSGSRLPAGGGRGPQTIRLYLFWFRKNDGNFLYVEQLRLKIQGIQVGKLESFKEEDLYLDSDQQKRYSKEIYFKAIDLVKEVTDSVRSQKLLNIRKAKHLMQKAVDSIMKEESALLGLTNIKNYDEYTFNHSVNVAIYALALGQRIGLPKKLLSIAWRTAS